MVRDVRRSGDEFRHRHGWRRWPRRSLAAAAAHRVAL